MENLAFKSNTYNKLLKIKDGKVFGNNTTFIKEFIQNCQRSKSRHIYFDIVEDNGMGILTCRDDGCGCKNPQYLFTLDYSNWESTTEGFGIGFWSCLSIPRLNEISIRSYNWNVSVDVNNIFNKKEESIHTTAREKMGGFEVRLSSDWILENKSILIDTINQVGKNIDIPIYINGCHIYQIDIVTECINRYIENDIYYYEVHNNLYDAVLGMCPSGYYYDEFKMFYENRYVKNIYDFQAIIGVIIPKNNKIDLIEPDRERIVINSKWYNMKERLRKDLVTLHKNYVSQNGVSDERYFDGINRYLDPKDFKKYLKLSFLEDDFIIEEDEPLFDNEDIDTNDIQENTIEKSTILYSSPVIENKAYVSKPSIERDAFKEEDQEINTFVRDTPCTNSNVEYNDFSKKKNILIKSVWVKSSEMETLKNNIAKARYCGIPVIVVDNILQENALIEENIPNVSTLDDVLSETIIKTNVCLKTNNEVAFIELLQPICDKFGLNPDTFRIANLETRREFTYNGKVVMKQREKNSKTKIVTYGLCDGMHIYLDRNALCLNKFKLKNCSKATKYAVLLKTSRTIAHEMAHYLYNTVDNTILHYKKEQKIWEEIIKLYVA